MSRCVICTLELFGPAGLCPHHDDGAYEQGWAVSNRVMCNFFHRRIVPPRPAATDRDDDFSRQTTETA